MKCDMRLRNIVFGKLLNATWPSPGLCMLEDNIGFFFFLIYLYCASYHKLQGKCAPLLITHRQGAAYMRAGKYIVLCRNVVGTCTSTNCASQHNAELAKARWVEWYGVACPCSRHPPVEIKSMGQCVAMRG